MKTTRSSDSGSESEDLGAVTATKETDVDQMIEKAFTAKPGWSRMPLAERIVILKRLGRKLKKYKKPLARLVTAEMGMPLRQSLADVDDAIRVWDWYLAHGPEILKPKVIVEGDGRKLVVLREPYGITAVVSPWNFPVSNFVWSCGQNLVAGNLVLYKPSEEIPGVTKLIEQIINEAMLPEGVVTVIYGGGDIGNYLVQQKVDLVCFTGSTVVGKQIYEIGAKKFIKVLLEMGGSAPGIVFKGADLHSTIESIYDNRFTNAGQMCDALKRLLVQEDIANKIIDKLTNLIQQKKVGDPNDMTTDIGALVSWRQLETLEGQVKDAVDKGAEIICGGKRITDLDGPYFEPTLITKITPEMRVWREEVFGPVLPIVVFRTENEAVRLANATEFGLGAYIYAGDGDLAWTVAQQLQTGMVSINGQSYIHPCSPFGGYKQSGMGRIHGIYGFEEVTQVKVIALPHYDSV